MSNEIEAKIKVAQHAPIRAALESNGGKRKYLRLETNEFFDTADGALRSSDRGLRVRHNHDLATAEDRYIITFKGPQQAGPFKSREEIETSVGDMDAMRRIFQSLGYSSTLSFEKKREAWALGDCEVALDELPLLGSFVEIEGPDAQRIATVQRQLGLGDHASIKTGYIALLLQYAQENGLKHRRIGFDATTLRA